MFLILPCGSVKNSYQPEFFTSKKSFQFSVAGQSPAVARLWRLQETLALQDPSLTDNPKPITLKKYFGQNDVRLGFKMIPHLLMFVKFFPTFCNAAPSFKKTDLIKFRF